MDPSNWRAALYKYMSANPTKEKVPAMASIQIQSTQLARVPSFYLYPDLDMGDGLTTPAAAAQPATIIAKRPRRRPPTKAQKYENMEYHSSLFARRV